MENELDKNPSVGKPVQKSSNDHLKRELAKAHLEIETFKRRKVIRFVDINKKILVKVLPNQVKAMLRKTILRPNIPQNDLRNRVAEIEKFSRNLSIESKYTYPNLRILAVDAVPTFKNMVPFVQVNNNWRKKLRPGLNSVDAVIFELPSPHSDSAFPYETAEDLASAAISESVPVIVICHKEEQLAQTKLLGTASLLIVATQALAKKVKSQYKNEVIKLKSFVDVLDFNPTGWEFEPSYPLLVIGQSAMTDEARKYKEELESKLSIPSFDEAKQNKSPKYRPFKSAQIDGELFSTAKLSVAALCIPSMFASYQVFESTLLQLLAGGVHVFTDDNKIVSQINVPALSLASDTKAINRVSSLVERERASIKSRRVILHEHSELSAFDELLSLTGITADVKRRISVILCTNRPDYINHAIQNVKKQTYTDKELILLLHGESFDVSSVEASLQQSNVSYKLLKLPSTMVFGECLNRGLDAASGYFVTKFDDDDHYGENHLLDLALAHEYSGAQVVGKWGHFVYLQESGTMLNYQLERQEKYGGHLPGGTFLIKRSLLDEFRFGRVRNAIDSELWDRLKKAGGQLYSTHRYNYVRVRHEDNTWNESDDFFKARSSGEVDGTGPEVGFI